MLTPTLGQTLTLTLGQTLTLTLDLCITLTVKSEKSTKFEKSLKFDILTSFWKFTINTFKQSMNFDPKIGPDKVDDFCLKKLMYGVFGVKFAKSRFYVTN